MARIPLDGSSSKGLVCDQMSIILQKGSFVRAGDADGLENTWTRGK